MQQGVTTLKGGETDKQEFTQEKLSLTEGKWHSLSQRQSIQD
jgi:hypothetical protein